jgi:hypothetical protein
MNEPINNSPDGLAAHVASLQRQVAVLLLALIVVSGTLTVYLWYQARSSGRDMEAIKPQAMQVVQTFNQDRPGMEKFVNQLITYGQTHPDFRPILQKYGIAPLPAAPKK